MSNKTLEYYMDLNYDINIHKFSEEEGGGYEASIPELGRHSFLGIGDTVEEAIEFLNGTKKILFEKFIAEGLEIPEPYSWESAQNQIFDKIKTETGK